MDIKFRKGQDPASPLVVVNCFGNEAEGLMPLLKGETPDHSLLAVSGLDWDNDLSPWKAEAVFKGGSGFGGRGGEYLRKLTSTILPDVISREGTDPSAVYIAGYSLAGLFALYALYSCDAFDGAASCSGSLWFPGFLDFAKTREFPKKPSRIYLSLGDKEAKTRNPVMATVEYNTRELFGIYRDMGIDTEFVLNPGNHFKDPEKRLSDGIRSFLMSPSIIK